MRVVAHARTCAGPRARSRLEPYRGRRTERPGLGLPAAVIRPIPERSSRLAAVCCEQFVSGCRSSPPGELARKQRRSGHARGLVPVRVHASVHRFAEPLGVAACDGHVAPKGVGAYDLAGCTGTAATVEPGYWCRDYLFGRCTSGQSVPQRILVPKSASSAKRLFYIQGLPPGCALARSLTFSCDYQDAGRWVETSREDADVPSAAAVEGKELVHVTGSGPSGAVAVEFVDAAGKCPERRPERVCTRSRRPSRGQPSS